MEVLVHVLVSEGILRGLLRGGDGGVHMLQLFRKPHAHLEWIRHFELGMSEGCRGVRRGSWFTLTWDPDSVHVGDM